MPSMPLSMYDSRYSESRGSSETDLLKKPAVVLGIWIICQPRITELDNHTQRSTKLGCNITIISIRQSTSIEVLSQSAPP
jgi:hypothetical protein